VIRVKVKATTHYWLSIALTIIALLLGVSALLLWIIFPHGYFPSRVWWLEVHKWTGFTLFLGVVIHLVLHWGWLVRMTRNYTNRWRNRSVEYPEDSPLDAE